MSTAVISDLHLGARNRVDLLRRPELREPLLEALDGVQRLVLLGDAIELRHGPLRDALEAARGLFEDLGRTLGDGAEVVLVPGNHDHTLLREWFAARRLDGPPPALGLEQRIEPAEASAGARQFAEWLGPVRFSLAYPGLWLRDDVYALHGHYVDCHLTVPTFERLAVSGMQRLVARTTSHDRTPESYESATEPLYDWIYAIAQHERSGSTAAGGAQLSAGVWRRLGNRSLAGRLAWAAVFRPVVAGANRAGLGPFRPDLSGPELRRAGLRAIGAVAERLDVDAAHLIFGHTHRSGPLPDDDRLEWTGPRGMRIWNSGNWIYARHFLTPRPGESPYWPGTIVRLDAEGPPRSERLLTDRPHEQLRPPPAV